MCPPEDIPEDRCQSFECFECGGDITLTNGKWECNGCGLTKAAQESGTNAAHASNKQSTPCNHWNIPDGGKCQQCSSTITKVTD